MTTLTVDDLCVGYLGSAIVDRVSLEVSSGEVVSVLGPNGSGKTTLMRAIAGIIDEYGGSTCGGCVRFLSEEVTGLPAHLLARRGLLFVPEGGRVFPSLSVQDNLDLALTVARHAGRTNGRLEQVIGVFPGLKTILRKKTFSLSTGEKQILALARSLLMEPRLLILDEPSAGLSLNYSEQVFTELRRLTSNSEIAALVVEQNARLALEHSDRAYVLKHGRNFWSGSSRDLLTGSQLEDLL